VRTLVYLRDHWRMLRGLLCHSSNYYSRDSQSDDTPHVQNSSDHCHQVPTSNRPLGGTASSADFEARLRGRAVGSGPMNSELAVDKSTTELEIMLCALQDHNRPAKDPFPRHA
jgi:hypothetical protein